MKIFIVALQNDIYDTTQNKTHSESKNAETRYVTIEFFFPSHHKEAISLIVHTFAMVER